MKKLTMFLSFAVLSAIIISCQSEHKKQSLEKTDKMFAQIEELQTLLSQKQVVDYRKVYDTVRKYNDFFLMLPENFVHTEETDDIAYQYGVVEKTFKKLHSHFLSVYANDLNISRNQINNLRDDIKNNRLSAEQIDNYLHVEDSILQDLDFRIKDKIDYAQSTYERYLKYQPKVEKLVKEYEFEL